MSKPSLDQLMRDAWDEYNNHNPLIKTPYHYYKLAVSKLEEPDFDLLVDDPNEHCTRAMTEEEFNWRMDNDTQFSARWK